MLHKLRRLTSHAASSRSYSSHGGGNGRSLDRIAALRKTAAVSSSLRSQSQTAEARLRSEYSTLIRRTEPWYYRAAAPLVAAPGAVVVAACVTGVGAPSSEEQRDARPVYAVGAAALTTAALVMCSRIMRFRLVEMRVDHVRNIVTFLTYHWHGLARSLRIAGKVHVAASSPGAIAISFSALREAARTRKAALTGIPVKKGSNVSPAQQGLVAIQVRNGKETETFTVDTTACELFRDEEIKKIAVNLDDTRSGNKIQA